MYRRKDEATEDGKVEEEVRGKSQRRKNRPTRKDGEEEEIPKFTSAYHEYNAGYWRRPKGEKIYVTLETEIPPMPKIIIEYPDESAYHKAQADIDEKIDAIKLKSNELGDRFTERL